MSNPDPLTTTVRNGLDFANALHLVSTRSAAIFHTFDKELVRRAARLPDVDVREA